MRLDNATNIHFNNKSAQSAYLNNNLVWSSIDTTQLLLLDASNYTSGSTWFDESENGYGNDATIFNSPTNDGSSFTLNGTNQYFDVADGFADFTSGLTILSFVNFGNANAWERIIDFGEGQASNNIIFSRKSTTNNLWFEIYGSGSSLFSVELSNGIINNGWGFYGIKIGGGYKLFTHISNVNDTTATLPANVTRTNNYIGRSNWSADTYFESKIGVIAIYNRELTDTEIDNFYNEHKSTYGL